MNESVSRLPDLPSTQLPVICTRSRPTVTRHNCSPVRPSNEFISRFFCTNNYYCDKVHGLIFTKMQDGKLKENSSIQ